jgi:hypothetical protein
MASVKFLKRVGGKRRLYKILAFIRDKASRDGFGVLEFDDEFEGSYKLIVGDRFEIVFRRTGEGEYVASGEFETADLKLLKTAYVILRSIRADIETSLRREELNVVAFAEPEIEIVDYAEDEEPGAAAHERGQTTRQTTLDEVM